MKLQILITRKPSLKVQNQFIRWGHVKKSITGAIRDALTLLRYCLPYSLMHLLRALLCFIDCFIFILASASNGGGNITLATEASECIVRKSTQYLHFDLKCSAVVRFNCDLEGRSELVTWQTKRCQSIV